MRRGALALLLCAACARRPKVPILDYHSVGQGGDEFTVDDGVFEAQLAWLQSEGVRTISLHELAQAGIAQRKSGEKEVVLTFDDGTADGLTHVLPALRRHGMKATFFIVTGFVGRPGYLTWDGVRALAAAGMEIGSHTVDHARLPDLPDDKALAELVESRKMLEAQLGTPVDLLAYPYNSLRAHTLRLAAQAGYRIAVAGAVHGGADLLDLYRTTIKRKTTLDGFRQALQP